VIYRLSADAPDEADSPKDAMRRLSEELLAPVDPGANQTL